MFESERAVLEHEASCGERRKRGEYPAGGYAKHGVVMLKLKKEVVAVSSSSKNKKKEDVNRQHIIK